MATKIQKISIAEFKILKDLDIDIAGANIMIVGENGLGKSSLMQFVEIALGKSTNIPPDATGNGIVYVDKDGEKYMLKVKIVDGKSTVTIEGKDGLRDSRKTTLKGIFGAMEFDIDEFVELSKTAAGRKKQVEIFKSFLPVETQNDFARLESNIKANYDERTEIGKQKKSVAGAIAENKMNVLQDSELAAIKEIDTVALSRELQKIIEENKKVAEVKNRQYQRKVETERQEKEILELQHNIEKITKEKEANKYLILKATEWLNTNTEKDISIIQTQLSEAGETNTKAAAARELIKQRSLLETLTEEEGQKTVLIETERQSIADAIKDCDSPVTGLVFDRDELKYNGIAVNPDSLSTSEIMELGIKLKMAENPDLGVLFIQRGESLGKQKLAQILDLAQTNNWQILMEQVQRGQDKLTIELIKL